MGLESNETQRYYPSPTMATTGRIFFLKLEEEIIKAINEDFSSLGFTIVHQEMSY